MTAVANRTEFYDTLDQSRQTCAAVQFKMCYRPLF